MSGHPQLYPYLNRFTALWQGKADVKLEFTCLDGNVIINLSHNIGRIEKVPHEEKTQKPNDIQVLKKNVSLSQIVRLQKRAAERAEAEKLEAEKAKVDSLEAVTVLVQHKLVEAEKATDIRARFNNEKAKNNAMESKNEAENAKIVAEEALGEAVKAKREDKQSTSEAEQAKSEAEKAMSEAVKLKGKLSKQQVKLNKQRVRL